MFVNEKHENGEIRMLGYGRIGRVDSGVFLPYGKFYQTPGARDYLKSLGFEDTNAESKDDSPAEDHKPGRKRGRSAAKGADVGGDKGSKG